MCNSIASFALINMLTVTCVSVMAINALVRCGRMIVFSIGVARLLAVYVTCFQPLPALRPRPGPMRNPSNTGACTVYFKSPA